MAGRYSNQAVNMAPLLPTPAYQAPASTSRSPRQGYAAAGGGYASQAKAAAATGGGGYAPHTSTSSAASTGAGGGSYAAAAVSRISDAEAQNREREIRAETERRRRLIREKAAREKAEEEAQRQRALEERREQQQQYISYLKDAFRKNRHNLKAQHGGDVPIEVHAPPQPPKRKVQAPEHTKTVRVAKAADVEVPAGNLTSQLAPARYPAASNSNSNLGSTSRARVAPRGTGFNSSVGLISRVPAAPEAGSMDVATPSPHTSGTPGHKRSGSGFSSGGEVDEDILGSSGGAAGVERDSLEFTPTEGFTDGRDAPMADDSPVEEEEQGDDDDDDDDDEYNMLSPVQEVDDEELGGSSKSKSQAGSERERELYRREQQLLAAVLHSGEKKPSQAVRDSLESSSSNPWQQAVELADSLDSEKERAKERESEKSQHQLAGRRSPIQSPARASARRSSKPPVVPDAPVEAVGGFAWLHSAAAGGTAGRGAGSEGERGNFGKPPTNAGAERRGDGEGERGRFGLPAGAAGRQGDGGQGAGTGGGYAHRFKATTGGDGGSVSGLRKPSKYRVRRGKQGKAGHKVAGVDTMSVCSGFTDNSSVVGGAGPGSVVSAGGRLMHPADWGRAQGSDLSKQQANRDKLQRRKAYERKVRRELRARHEKRKAQQAAQQPQSYDPAPYARQPAGPNYTVSTSARVPEARPIASPKLPHSRNDRSKKAPPKSQLSLDEERLMQSLQRLDGRLADLSSEPKTNQTRPPASTRERERRRGKKKNSGSNVSRAGFAPRVTKGASSTANRAPPTVPVPPHSATSTVPRSIMKPAGAGVAPGSIAGARTRRAATSGRNNAAAAAAATMVNTTPGEGTVYVTANAHSLLFQ